MFNARTAFKTTHDGFCVFLVVDANPTQKRLTWSESQPFVVAVEYTKKIKIYGKNKKCI